MSVIRTAAECLLILGSLEAITIAQWAQWIAGYKMWNRSVSMHTGRYWHQSFQNLGLLSSSAEVSGFLKYELHIKGTLVGFLSSLNCIKFELWFVVRGLNFPR
jgi:hypothetical protein